MLDRNEWVIVRWRNEHAHLEPHEREGLPEYDLLIRKRYQWEAQKLSYRWEYVAKGLTKEEADAYTKLFKE